jgi:hypothetical protein
LKEWLRNEFSWTPVLQYECYLYGPLTEYFTSIFPNKQNFMLAPQLYLCHEHIGRVSSVAASTRGSVHHVYWFILVYFILKTIDSPYHRRQIMRTMWRVESSGLETMGKMVLTRVWVTLPWTILEAL